MSQNVSRFDAIVIGGGPAGITAALYLVRSGCSVALIEKLTHGGQVLQTEAIENYPGFPKGIKGWELADAFVAHLDGLEISRFTSEITFMEVGEDCHRVRMGDEWIEGRSIIICSGTRHRPIGLENELKFLGRGVSYCAICDGNFFRGKEVAVIGGGNTALEESLYLSKIASKVHLIHRREEFRGAKIYLDRLEEKSDVVNIIRSTIVTHLEGDSDLTGLRLKNVATEEESSLMVDGVFVFVGLIACSEFVPQMVDRDAQGFLITDTEMRTNVSGIFAAGDIRSKLCRQVSTAVGDGATAAQAAFLYLEQVNA